MPSDGTRRKDLKQRYRENPPESGVYRIVNAATGKSLLGSAANLQAVANRLAFAKSTGSLSALDPRLRRDLGDLGVGALTFEILDVLDRQPGSTADDVAAELATLEALWREKLGAAALY
jgi:hypothetical protein